jgi:uncharacterized protein YpmB
VNIKKRDKKAVLGVGMTTFIATIAIVIILIIFALVSGVIKLVSIKSEIKYTEESDVGIFNIFSYSGDFAKLANVRFFIEKGFELNKAIEESEYEE